MNTPIMKTTMREGLVGARHGNGSTQHKEESEQHLNNKKQIQIYEIPGKVYDSIFTISETNMKTNTNTIL